MKEGQGIKPCLEGGNRMYIPFNKQKQKKYYGGLFRKFLSWNLDELELSEEEKQEIIEVFEAFICALKTCK